MKFSYLKLIFVILLLANILYSQEEDEVISPEKEGEYLLAVENNPKDTNAYYQLIKIYNSQNKHKESLQISLKALKNIGGNSYLYRNIGDKQRVFGNTQEAVISYNNALSYEPNNHTIYNRIGLIYLDLKSFHKAEASFNAALFFSQKSSAKTRAIYLNNLAMAYEGTGEYNKAYDCLDNSLKLFPGYIAAKNNLDRIKTFITSTNN